MTSPPPLPASADSCPGCQADVSKAAFLGEAVAVCSGCRLGLGRCARCGSLEALTGRHCGGCGILHRRDAEGYGVELKRFHTLDATQANSDPAALTTFLGTSGQSPTVQHLLNIPCVSLGPRGVLMVAGPDLGVQATPSGAETPGFIGFPEVYSTPGACIQTGSVVMQVGATKASFFLSTALSDASWTGRVAPESPFATLDADTVGFGRFVKPFGWVDSTRCIVAGTDLENPARVGLAILEVTPKAGELVVHSGEESPLWVGEATAEGLDWSGGILTWPGSDRSRIVLSNGADFWSVDCSRGTLQLATPNHHRADLDGVRSFQIVASLMADHTSLCVAVTRKTRLSPHPRCWLEWWIPQPNGAVTRQPVGDGEPIQYAKTIRAGATRLLAVRSATADGTVRFLQHGQLNSTPWGHVAAPQVEDLVQTVIGPDFVAGIGQHMGQRFLMSATIHAGRDRRYAASAPISVQWAANATLHLSAGLQSVAVLSSTAIQTRLAIFPITRQVVT